MRIRRALFADPPQAQTSNDGGHLTEEKRSLYEHFRHLHFADPTNASESGYRSQTNTTASNDTADSSMEAVAWQLSHLVLQTGNPSKDMEDDSGQNSTEHHAPMSLSPRT